MLADFGDANRSDVLDLDFRRSENAEGLLLAEAV